MTEYDPPLGSLPDQDHDHDVLLVAGSRPEVARLAPVATAFNDVDRIRAVTVATGPDPMAVHEAFEALGVPADVTAAAARAVRPRQPGLGRRDAHDPPRRVAGRPRPVGDHGLRRRDDRGDRGAGRVLAADPDRPPAGGGGERRPALPVPAGGQPPDHRPARLPVPHHRRRRARQPDRARTRSPSATRWPPTRSPPTCASPACSAGCGPTGRASCWSRSTGSIRSASSPGSPSCSTASPTSRSCSSASWAPTGPRRRSRATRAAPSSATCRSPISSPCSASSAVLVSDNPELVSDAPGFGTPAVLVDGPLHRRAGRLHPQHPQPARDGHGPPAARGAPACARAVRRAGGHPRRAGRGVDVRPHAARPCSSCRTRGSPRTIRRRLPTRRSGSRRVAPCSSRTATSPRSWPTAGSCSNRGTPAMLQPSSIDVRLDRYFRVFQNSRYTHIDPAQQQDELTTPVEPDGDDPFVLHPGEFVLGLDVRGHLAARRPRRAVWRARARSAASACSPTRRRASSTPGSAATSRWSCRTSPTCRSRCGRG